jgi:large subunit ribosomal protein L4
MEPHQAVMHQAVKQHLANLRSGTASTRTRGEVRGGGRKPWRQKGTGRARAGSRRSPIWTGGGTVFGPKPRDYSQAMPKKMKRLALVSALSAKTAAHGVVVMENVPGDEIKTRNVAEALGRMEFEGKTMFVLEGANRNFTLSVRNLPRVTSCTWQDVGTYDVLNHDQVIFTREALARIEEARS